MKKERKIIVYIAVSADGYIARADGSVDWLKRPRPPGHYGMGAFLRSIDTILWGRKTYDQAFWPPSTSSVVQVMYDASGLARKATAAATSSDLP